MATNGVDPGGYYPPMVTGGASGVGTDPYAPTPAIPTPPTANPSPASPISGYSGGVGLLSPLQSTSGGPALSFFAEDGGGIPDNGTPDPSAQGTPDNGVQANQGFSADQLGSKDDQVQKVQDTLDWTRKQFLGQNFGHGTDDPNAQQQSPMLDLTHQGFDDGGGVIPDDQSPGDADQATANQNAGADQNADQGTSVFGSTAQTPVLSSDTGLNLDAVAARVGDQFNQAATPATSQQTQNSLGAIGAALNPATLHENEQRIWAYLTGQNAAPPQTVNALEQQVDPKGDMDPNDRALAAVTAADKTHGPQAASSVLQAYRQQYDHYRAFAGAAATGGNMDSAIDAANQAFTKLPDGHKIVFEKGDKDSVVAHLQGQDGNAAGQVNLTPDQFSSLVRGPAGLFDNMMDAGSTTMLRKLFTGQNTNDQSDQTGATPSTAAVGIQRGTNRSIQAVPREGATPAANTQGSVRSQLAKLMGVDEDTITQVLPSPRDQFKLLMQQKQQSTTNQINQTKANNPLGLAQLRAQNALDVQGARNSGNLAVQNAKAATWAKTYDLRDRNEQNKLLLQAQLSQRTQQGRNAISMARGMLSQGRTMDDVNNYFAKQGVDFGRLSGLAALTPTTVTTQIAQPGGQLQAQQAQPQTVIVGGVTYVRQPNGKYLSQ